MAEMPHGSLGVPTAADIRASTELLAISQRGSTRDIVQGSGGVFPPHDCHAKGTGKKSKFAQAREREKWKSRTEFLLTLIGYTIGLGNVWRFPHLCHKNGGASFLIPYGVMLAVEGIPLYYMELCIGQRMRKGSVGVWNEISPYLGGVGIASVVVCFLVSLYYNVIIAWCVFYFIKSFESPLPWSQCPEEEITIGNVTKFQTVRECKIAGPTSYFWFRSTLNISDNIENGGGMNWVMCACLIGTWILVWLCMMKGIKITGKIVYITALLPIVLLIIFFFCGVHLKGFQDGLALLFIPEFNRLKEFEVWYDAATQIFFSLGVAYGSLIAFSSYNPIKNDSTRDAIIVCFINCATSIYASVVVFCFIGFQAQSKMDDCVDTQRAQLAEHLNKSAFVRDGQLTVTSDDLVYSQLLTNVSKLMNGTLVLCDKQKFLNQVPSGQGLAFIIFTDAINKMPLSTLWAVMFFLMLITIGIDTEFGMLEGVVTPIIDMKLLPSLNKEVLSGVICMLSCLLGLVQVQYSGEYWLQLVDGYCSGIPLLIIALVECIAISCVYGNDRFSEDIKYMTNKPPRFIWKWCWKFISPLAILTVLFMSIKGLSENIPSYSLWDENAGMTVLTPYPPWAVFCGICLTLVSVFWIPAVAFLRYFRFLPVTDDLPLVALGSNLPQRQPLRQRQPNNSERDEHRHSPVILDKARNKFKRKGPKTNGRVPHYANGTTYHLVGQQNGNTPML